MPEADALILFSCAGRLISMGPMMSEEIEGVRKVSDVPMAGMFSTAELVRATNGILVMYKSDNVLCRFERKINYNETKMLS